MTRDQFDALGVMMGSHADSTAHDALRLVLVDGLTQSEAAARLGVPHQHVARKMQRARELHAAAQVLAGAEMPAARKYRETT